MAGLVSWVIVERLDDCTHLYTTPRTSEMAHRGCGAIRIGPMRFPTPIPRSTTTFTVALFSPDIERVCA